MLSHCILRPFIRNLNFASPFLHLLRQVLRSSQHAPRDAMFKTNICARSGRTGTCASVPVLGLRKIYRTLVRMRFVVLHGIA